MGNRAVITTSKSLNITGTNDLGIYLHWNGGRDSVEAFLKYCELKGYPSPERDKRGWDCLCYVISNFFGGSDIKAEPCRYLDCDNWDNGVYVIENWKIVNRLYNRHPEQRNYDLLEMLNAISDSQPEAVRLTEEELAKGAQESR